MKVFWQSMAAPGIITSGTKLGFRIRLARTEATIHVSKHFDKEVEIIWHGVSSDLPRAHHITHIWYPDGIQHTNTPSKVCGRSLLLLGWKPGLIPKVAAPTRICVLVQTEATSYVCKDEWLGGINYSHISSPRVRKLLQLQLYLNAWLEQSIIKVVRHEV